MAIARLTVDLVASTAAFEAGIGRATTTAATSTTQLTRGQAAFIRTLERQAQQASMTRAQLLELKAAQLGVGDAAAKYIAQIKAAEARTTGASIGNRLGAVVATLGISAGVADYIRSLKGALDTADRIDDLAEKFGVAAERLSAYRVAAEVAGTPTEALATGLRTLSKNLAEGGPAFAAIGVQTRQATGALREADTVLLEIADKFASYEDGAGKAALAQALFGKSGADLIPFLNRGGAGIKALTDEAQALGAVMSNETAAAAGRFNDNLKRLELASEGAKVALLGGLLPSLNSTAEAFIRNAKEAGIFGGALLTLKEGVAARLGFDELGGLQADAARTAAEISRVTNIVTGLSNVLEREPGNETAQRRYATLTTRLRELQTQAAATSEQIKRVANAMDPLPSTNASGAAPVKTPPPVVGDSEEARKAAEAAAKAYRQLIGAITEKRSAAELELAGTEKATEAQKFALDVVGKLATGEAKLSDAQKRGVAAALEAYLAAAQTVEIRRQLTEAEQRYARDVERTGEALARERTTIDDQNAALLEQIQTLGLTADAVERLRIKRLEESLAAREAAIAIERASGAAVDPNAEREDAVTAALRRQIELRRELLELQQREAEQQDLRQAAADSAATLARGAADAVLQFGSLRDVVRGVVTDLARITVRATVEAPLQRQLEGLIGAGIGVDTAGQTAAIAAQTTAVTTNTGAMVALTTAANAAAASLAAVSAAGAGDAASSIFSLFGGTDFGADPFAAIGLASGTNYVPYDGMRATLHKGEAVVPAKYNPAAGGRGTGNVSVIVENYSGGQARVEERSLSDGGREMRVIIEAAVAEVDRRIAVGGSTHKAVRQTFGVGPALARRG